MISLPLLGGSKSESKMLRTKRLRNSENEKERLQEELVAIRTKLSQLELESKRTREKLHQSSLKKKRKVMEKDAQALRNRINLLKSNQNKIWKKVDELDKQMRLVKNNKKNRKRVLKKKHSAKKVVSLTSAEFYNRDPKMAKTIRMELAMKKKEENFKKMKAESKKREKLYKMKQRRILKTNRKKSEKIKRSISLGKMMKQYHERKKLKKITKILKKENKVEKRKIQRAKRRIKEMCKVEEDWLRKLRESQVVQNAAFDKLMAALNEEQGSDMNEKGEGEETRFEKKVMDRLSQESYYSEDED